MIDRKEIRKALVMLRKEYGIIISPRRIMRIVGELERGEYDKSPYLKRFIESILYTTQTAFGDEVVTCSNTGEDLIEKLSKISCSATGIPPSFLDYETNANLEDLSSDDESSLSSSMEELKYLDEGLKGTPICRNKSTKRPLLNIHEEIGIFDPTNGNKVSIFGPGLLDTPTLADIRKIVNPSQEIVECEPKPLVKLKSSLSICGIYGLYEIPESDIKSFIYALESGTDIMYNYRNGGSDIVHPRLENIVAIDDNFLATINGSYHGREVLSEEDKVELMILLRGAKNVIVNSSGDHPPDHANLLEYTLGLEKRICEYQGSIPLTLTPYDILHAIFKVWNMTRYYGDGVTVDITKLPQPTPNEDLPIDYISISGRLLDNYMTSLFLNNWSILSFGDEVKKMHFSGDIDSIVAIDEFYILSCEEYDITKLDLLIWSQMELIQSITFRVDSNSRNTVEYFYSGLTHITQKMGPDSVTVVENKRVDVNHLQFGNK